MGRTPQVEGEYSGNWIIGGIKDTLLQGCKQLNKSKTLTTV